MKGKKKDSKTGFPDFLRYRGNSLSGSDKNAFERELQKDPFAAEADEGFSATDPAALASDMLELERRMSSRTRKVKRIAYYRFAAAAAIILLLMTQIIIVRIRNPKEIADKGDTKETIFTISKPEAITGREAAPAIAQNQESPGKIDRQPAEKSKSTAPGEAKMDKEAVVAKDSAEFRAEEVVVMVAEEEKAAAVSREIAMPLAVKSEKSFGDRKVIRGLVLSSEDNKPIPGASVMIRGTSVATTTDSGGNFMLAIPEKTKPDLVANYIGMERKEFHATGDSAITVKMDPDLTALNEVVVVGYGTKKTDAYSFKAAEPVTGNDAFNRYIDENIVRPDTLTESRRQVVILEFSVKLNGRTDNIKVIKSPGKKFSDEAIRLILEGPAWKPAVENGVNIEEKVRVRIVFR
jgi:hypothetical protein